MPININVRSQAGIAFFEIISCVSVKIDAVEEWTEYLANRTQTDLRHKNIEFLGRLTGKIREGETSE